MKENFYNIVQIILSIVLTLAILLQQKGGGLSAAFGGSSNVYTTRRGIDKILHIATIIISTLFFGTSLVRLFY